MSFLDSVARAKGYLEEHGRVSLSALKREFDLSDEALDELVDELTGVQGLARLEGRTLVRSGLSAPIPPPPGRARWAGCRTDIGCRPGSIWPTRTFASLPMSPAMWASDG